MISKFFSTDTLWLLIGLTGQLFFSARFIIQWIKSEYEKRSVIPVLFWHFSILGGLTLLAYAIHRRDPVFILGQLFGTFIYIRNLFLIHAESKRQRESSKQATPSLRA